MTDELKPVHCGCGGEPQLMYRQYDFLNITAFFEMCPKCGMSTAEKATPEEAIEIWNKAIGERTAKVEMLLCGNCHESNIFDVVTRQHYKYCPNCGCRLGWNE